MRKQTILKDDKTWAFDLRPGWWSISNTKTDHKSVPMDLDPMDTRADDSDSLSRREESPTGSERGAIGGTPFQHRRRGSRDRHDYGMGDQMYTDARGTEEWESKKAKSQDVRRDSSNEIEFRQSRQKRRGTDWGPHVQNTGPQIHLLA